jgi:LacI family transcriptional regulator
MVTRRVGIREVADLANVSPGTVSIVMNNKSGVAGTTRRRVFNAAKQLGYKPNFIASGLRKGKTDTIAFIHPTSDNLFLDILKGINQEVENLRYPVLVSCSHDDPSNEASIIELFSQIKPCAIIITPVPGDSNIEVISRIKEEYDPRIIFLERYLQGVQGDYLGSENVLAGYKFAKKLLKEGYRKIGCVFNESTYSTDNERLEGIKKALAEDGIEPKSNWFLNLKPQKLNKLEPKIKDFFTGPDAPNAVFWSIGKGHSLIDKIVDELGLKNGKNIEIVLFDCDHTDLPQNTKYINICQDGISLGRQAVKMINKSNGKKKNSENVKFEKKVLPCQYSRINGIEQMYI